MSSPIHHAEDLDAALIYAPPWAREQASPRSILSTPLVERPSRLERIDYGRRGFSGDRAMLDVQRQLALNPDKVPDPPADDVRHLWPMALRLCAVTGVAATIAWAMVLVPTARKPGSATTQSEPAPTPIAVNRVKLVHFSAAAKMPPLPPTDRVEISPPPQQAALPQALPQQAPPQQTPPRPAPPPQPDTVVTAGSASALDIAEIATLVQRGHELLQNGDLTSARLLLRRAAEAGSAAAALALGATYDPLVIQRLGVIGIKPDTARAREWYQRAAELGSDVASRQLANQERAQ